ncbi:hypothetical protein PC9H_009946 [Pleurotus ostreatus]|uniref:Uncharacterized protein n=1 Tax=Pleurotus ostreatus TaxID=5322 RepID=A0A8H6ZMR9_PLEOS|nr:uncharacterized protein PC9H_009946 [Pleurotus ostreatus]KAF7424638.1 hypothetical protein PC9H_009946 [Pleurotus ostreatus]
MADGGLSRATSMFESGVVGAGPVTGTSTRMAFPEPQMYRSTSSSASLTPPTQTMRHSRSRSDLSGQRAGAPQLRKEPSMVSIASHASSYHADHDEDEHYYTAAESSATDGEAEDLSKELSKLSLDSEENLLNFQKGKLQDKDQEWHKLVPDEAREALGKEEVQRQSVIFEVIKSEADYVADLVAVQAIFIHGLRAADPPIIEGGSLESFISEVFYNGNNIIDHHQRMLAALFARQRDQHPLIQSIADVILEAILNPGFRDSYITYIKHYPIAESRHRRELKKNKSYATFIHAVTSATSSSISSLQKLSPTHLSRIRKRDLVTFLSRPVTRLPRLNLLLGQILKLTEKGDYEDHPDLQTLPIILGIIGDCVKETQPGIEAAEAKVKFWALCENMVLRPGEILNMDLYDDNRTLVYESMVARRGRSDAGFSTWLDQNLALLDNYLLINQEEKRGGPTFSTRLLTQPSKPIHLSYLRLASFSGPPETRREKAEDTGGILDSLRRVDVALYPFTVYHASSRSTRRYTFYVTSEALRQKWHNALLDTLAVNRVRDEASMWFLQKTMNDRFFRSFITSTPASSEISGRIIFSGRRKFIAVGCITGIYLSPKGDEAFRKVLSCNNPISMAAIQSMDGKDFNKFLVHYDTSLVSYSLDLLARFALGEASKQALDASLERIAGGDSGAGTGNVLFFKHAQVERRMLVIYASRKTLSLSVGLNVLEAMDVGSTAIVPKRSGSSMSFRPLGEPGSIPKDAHDVTVLVKTIGVCTTDSIVIVNPTNVAKSYASLVPDFSSSSQNPPMADLKEHTLDAKPLGLVRSNDRELLVIYDTLGCYISKHGVPQRKSGYIKWETQAASYAHRGPHILLFSASFIEVREIESARLVQVIEGNDIRLLYSGPLQGEFEDVTLVAMKNGKDDTNSKEKVVALEPTVAIQSSVATPASASSQPGMWDEWDM